MVNKNTSQKTVNFLLLPKEFDIYANPIILMMNMKTSYEMSRVKN